MIDDLLSGREPDTVMLHDVVQRGLQDPDPVRCADHIRVKRDGHHTARLRSFAVQRIELTADKESYQAGDTANIFIPNPFVTNSLALVTVERGLISKAEVITLSGGGQTYSLPLTDDDAPNVYVNVLILGQGNDFRHGLVNIPIAPDAQELKVQLFSNPSEAGPRDQVTFDVVVTDDQEQPVQGEFSLSVVDQAVLALADPNAEDILPAFYSDQPLGIGAHRWRHLGLPAT